MTPAAAPRSDPPRDPSPGPRARIWPVALHAPVVAFLTAAVLLTDDRSRTWTRLSELLLELAGLPLSFMVTSVLAFSPPSQEWTLDAIMITAAWVNVVVLAVLTRSGVPARLVLEAVAMLAAGVGIWAALLSWADEAAYGLLPSLAAGLLVLVTVVLLSLRRPPVLVAVCVGGGAFVAVCAHSALNSAFWIFLAVPLAIVGGGALAAAAWLGVRLRRRGLLAPS